MDIIVDIFNGAAFSATTLTRNINIVPNMYGRIRELGIFRDEPIATTSVAVGITRGVLNLIPSRPRNAPPTYGAPEKRSVQNFTIPYFPHDDAVYTTDVQNMLSWSGGILTAAALESVIGWVNRKLATIRNKHSITLEYLRVGALTGVILDADGSTLLNLFSAFGITQYSVDFVLGTSTTDIGSIIDDLHGYMVDNLLGEVMTGIYCLASPLFMKRLLAHASVKTAYQFFNAANGMNPNRNNMRMGFEFHGCTFEEYRGVANQLNEDNTTTQRPFITPGEARFFPTGTMDTFVNYWAPPNFISAVNEVPQVEQNPVFVAPLEPMKFGAGYEMHTEQSPLPMVKRPQLLVRGFSST